MPRRKETRGRKKVLTDEQFTKNKRMREQKWTKEHSRSINVRFNKEKDSQILAKLDSVPNKAEYLRQLILNDLKN